MKTNEGFRKGDIVEWRGKPFFVTEDEAPGKFVRLEGIGQVKEFALPCDLSLLRAGGLR